MAKYNYFGFDGPYMDVGAEYIHYNLDKLPEDALTSPAAPAFETAKAMHPEGAERADGHDDRGHGHDAQDVIEADDVDSNGDAIVDDSDSVEVSNLEDEDIVDSMDSMEDSDFGAMDSVESVDETSEDANIDNSDAEDAVVIEDPMEGEFVWILKESSDEQDESDAIVVQDVEEESIDTANIARRVVHHESEGILSEAGWKQMDLYMQIAIVFCLAIGIGARCCRNSKLSSTESSLSEV